MGFKGSYLWPTCPHTFQSFFFSFLSIWAWKVLFIYDLHATYIFRGFFLWPTEQHWYKDVECSVAYFWFLEVLILIFWPRQKCFSCWKRGATSTLNVWGSIDKLHRKLIIKIFVCKIILVVFFPCFSSIQKHMCQWFCRKLILYNNKNLICHFVLWLFRLFLLLKITSNFYYMVKIWPQQSWSHSNLPTIILEYVWQETLSPKP